MLLKIIFFVCFIPTPLIMYFVFLNDTKPKKNLILGVTLPNAARQDDSVTGLIKKFKRLLTVVVLLVTLLSIPALFLTYDSFVLTYFMVWILLAIILPFVPYAVYNKKLKALKASNGWYSESAVILPHEAKEAAPPPMPKHKLNAFWFIPPVLISLIPIIHTVSTLWGTDDIWPMLIVYSTFAASIILFLFIYRIIYNQKAEVVDENTSINDALTQLRIYSWGKCWIWLAWLTGIFNLLFWLLRDSVIAIIIACIAYSAILLTLILRVEFKTRKIQQKLTENSGKTVYTDEDDKWIFGMFYYSPSDSHFMVNERAGIGMTMNLARTPAKILAAFTIILLLAMPFSGLWLMKEEFTPVKLITEDTRIVASHTTDIYEISYGDIESAELIYALPDGKRTNGTAMSNVLKGSFKLDGIGPCKLCLDPRTPPYIEIETADRIYVLGSADSSETLAVYGAINNAVIKR